MRCDVNDVYECIVMDPSTAVLITSGELVTQGLSVRVGYARSQVRNPV